MTSRTTAELEGKAAVDFAASHLRKVQSDLQTWEIEYEDLKTGERWIMDYAHSEGQGGGSPRLRKLTTMI